MSNKLCRKAIESRLSTWAASLTPPLQVAWENIDFPGLDGSGNPLPMPTTYLVAYMLPANTTGFDLAGAGREYSGVYQLTVVTPMDAGAGAAESVVDELAALFPLNMSIDVTGLTLKIVSPVTAGKGMPDGNSFTVPAWFRYRADTI